MSEGVCYPSCMSMRSPFADKLTWGKALLLAALAGGGWLGCRAYQGSGVWTAAEPAPVDAAPGAVSELTAANFDGFVAGGQSPALVVFYRTSCPYCRASLPALDRLGAQANGRYRIGKLDVEAEAASAGRFGIRGVPAFLFFSRGKPAGSLTGAPAGDAEGIYEGLKGFIDQGLAGASS